MKASSPELNKALRATFWRSFAQNSSWEYTRQLGVGFGFSMIPTLRVIYKDDKEGLSEAMDRQMQMIGITNVLSPLLMGIATALEEENKRNPEFDTNIINNIKVSLMGPISAIGDSLLLVTWRIICMGISLDLCLKGNFLGPLIFFVSYNIPTVAARWFSLKVGYEQGTNFIEKMSESNLIQSITEKAGILGMIVVGAMVPSFITVNSPITIGSGEAATSLIDTLDQILPAMLPLLGTLLVYWMVKRNWKVGTILIIITAFSIICAGFNILTA